MSPGKHDISLRVFDVLLRLYPAAYRRAYGPQMKQMFADMLRDYKTGTVWATLLWDVPTSALGEHIDALTSGEYRMQKRFPGILITILIPVSLAVLILTSWEYLDALGMWSAGFLLLVTIICLGLWLIVPEAKNPPAPARFAWLRPGILAGLAVGLVALPWVGGLFGPELDVFVISVTGFLVVMPVAFGLAGFASGRASRQARQGFFAGVLSAAVSAAVLFAGFAIVMTVFWPGMRAAALQDPEMMGIWQSSGIPTFDAYIWTVRANSAEGTSIFLMPFGLAMGTLGGLIGSASRRRFRIQIVQE